jgi:hypothetical protein
VFQWQKQRLVPIKDSHAQWCPSIVILCEDVRFVLSSSRTTASCLFRVAQCSAIILLVDVRTTMQARGISN